LQAFQKQAWAVTPLLDLNYGVGDRIQLKYAVPWVVAESKRNFGGFDVTFELGHWSHPAAESADASVLFRGGRALCQEYSLVLESKAIDHEVLESDGAWLLTVAPSLQITAYDELTRYCAERSILRPQSRFIRPFGGAGAGAIAYAAVLLLTAYFAGLHLFSTDWYAVGVIDAGPARAEWWRAITALTLHVDPAHLISNLFFGIIVGAAASRLLGPGVAWLAALSAGTLANYVEMWIAPAAHRALGASTAVFAALGLLTGLAWTERLNFRERKWYRWAPLIAGVCLLTLFGAGGEHVDVLGHCLGFMFGTAAGCLCALAGMPRNRGIRLQLLCGMGALGAVGLAWLLALYHAHT
jgi:rhomboid protease GluP